MGESGPRFDQQVRIGSETSPSLSHAGWVECLSHGKLSPRCDKIFWSFDKRNNRRCQPCTLHLRNRPPAIVRDADGISEDV